MEKQYNYMGLELDTKIWNENRLMIVDDECEQMTEEEWFEVRLKAYKNQMDLLRKELLSIAEFCEGLEDNSGVATIIKNRINNLNLK